MFALGYALISGEEEEEERKKALPCHAIGNCEVCGRIATRSCLRCKLAWYCSRQCEDKNLTHHDTCVRWVQHLGHGWLRSPSHIFADFCIRALDISQPIVYSVSPSQNGKGYDYSLRVFRALVERGFNVNKSIRNGIHIGKERYQHPLWMAINTGCRSMAMILVENARVNLFAIADSALPNNLIDSFLSSDRILTMIPVLQKILKRLDVEVLSRITKASRCCHTIFFKCAYLYIISPVHNILKVLKEKMEKENVYDVTTWHRCGCCGHDLMVQLNAEMLEKEMKQIPSAMNRTQCMLSFLQDLKGKQSQFHKQRCQILVNVFTDDFYFPSSLQHIVSNYLIYE
jgi:hypothetical protein